VSDRFAARGQSAAVASVHTLKPLDKGAITDILARFAHVVVIEECAPNGSLSMRVKELAWETRATCRLDAFTLRDEFIHCYGSHDDLLAEHGLSTESICSHLSLN
jgi:transketolase